eukprot:gb/GEZN01000453.1/.p1 GENE.gb/GEZN01000453.1/~~gb/GEZN01000453.1/.p1  ORF type:complete len:1061 (-),score=254.99 gb/GEZN01000453.1/:759-3941(-)
MARLNAAQSAANIPILFLCLLLLILSAESFLRPLPPSPSALLALSSLSAAHSSSSNIRRVLQVSYLQKVLSRPVQDKREQLRQEEDDEEGTEEEDDEETEGEETEQEQTEVEEETDGEGKGQGEADEEEEKGVADDSSSSTTADEVKEAGDEEETVEVEAKAEDEEKKLEMEEAKEEKETQEELAESVRHTTFKGKGIDPSKQILHEERRKRDKIISTHENEQKVKKAKKKSKRVISDLSVFVTVDHYEDLIHLKQTLSSLMSTQEQLEVATHDTGGVQDGDLGLVIKEVILVPVGSRGLLEQNLLRNVAHSFDPPVQILPIPWQQKDADATVGVRLDEAVSAAVSDMVLVLSQFVEVQPSTLTLLYRTLHNAPNKKGMVSGKLVLMDGTLHHAGRELMFGQNRDPDLERELSPYLENRLQGNSADDARSLKAESVVAGTRALLMFEKANFLAVGGFELAGNWGGPLLEADLAFRMRKQLKLHSWYVPEARALWNADSSKQVEDGDSAIEAFGRRWEKECVAWLPVRDPALINITLDWNMECGAGAVLGFTTEGVNIVRALDRKLRVRVTVDDRQACLEQLRLARFSVHLQTTMRRTFQVMKKGSAIQVMHRDPGRYQQHVDTGAALRVGRSMYETDRIPVHWINNIKGRVEQVWVPSRFNVDTFSQAGVPSSMLVALPESIDVYHFQSNAHSALSLPDHLDRTHSYLDMFHARVHPSAKHHTVTSYKAADETEKSLKSEGESLEEEQDNDPDRPASQAWFSKKQKATVEWSSKQKADGFRFLMVGKWEMRKGWDYMLRAYFETFSAKDPVSLLVMTRLSKTDKDDLDMLLSEYVGQDMELLSLLPPLFFLEELLPYSSLPSLYKAADAFLLPTHGEGWGLPIMEAMAMEVPVIVTNWSGLTAFTTDDIAYLVKVAGLENAEGVEDGTHQWAVPDLEDLKSHMLDVVVQPKRARKKAKAARQHIVTNFHWDVVAEQYVTQIKKLLDEKEELLAASQARKDQLPDSFSNNYNYGDGHDYNDWGGGGGWGGNVDSNNPYSSRANSWNTKPKPSGHSIVKINP